MRKGLVPTLLFLAPALVAGFALAWFAKPDPDPVYREVKVPVETIVEVERVDTIVQLRERLVFREVEPRTVAVADSGGAPDMDAFCAQAVDNALAAASPPDSSTARPESAPSPVLLLRSIRTEPGWFWQEDRLVATGPRSDGSLWQGTYDVRPGYQAHVRGPELLVQSPRWWWVQEGVEAGVFLGIGYLLGTL